ncbi:hypothetical protein Nepgr_029069 [Nepenthes gracilis]|uniref:Uncharacterized protein n=1 Tax=Nepenthes gracilis TaxID=150966 RepID=A0AAD3Y570_NEPGR|nr:hypothetical protein Nepgr_029069 [Nepenthes gracilis]
MGNYVSCALAGATVKNRAAAAKVVFPTGEIRSFCEPTKAAELMFEMPYFFLVNLRSLQMGRRFSALNADEDLEMGNAYAMFPMKRLNSVVSAADMGALFLVANSAAKRISSGTVALEPGTDGIGQVVTATSVAAGGSRHPEVGVPKLNLDDIEELCSSEFRLKLSMCRSKKPLLETIAEESICSRC